MSQLRSYRLLSFDVYGTLIDWETGVLSNLTPLLSRSPKLPPLTRPEILDLYHSLEKSQQSKTPSMPYSQLTATIYGQFATHIGLPDPPASETLAFGQSVGTWPPFPDTVDALHRLSKFYKLVVLSNVDRDAFGASNAGPLAGVAFDAVITAQDVGAYKPDHANFEYMLKTVRDAFGVEKAQVLQTAQSQFHDHRPARELGIRSVWIERRGTMGNVGDGGDVYDWKFETLGEMAEAVEREFASEE